jgi:hypothetical protein
MTFVRTVVAALIAISVAVLPATGAAIVVPSDLQASMIERPDMPCCPCCNAQNNSELAACALKCISLVGVFVSSTAVMPFFSIDGVPARFAEHPLHAFTRPPPTHPPRA